MRLRAQQHRSGHAGRAGEDENGFAGGLQSMPVRRQLLIRKLLLLVLPYGGFCVSPALFIKHAMYVQS